MPMRTPDVAPRRIAVVGGGISGLGAARMLSRDHRVTLYEAESRLGGHARTVLAGRRGDQPVDTGFIVFNRPNYPQLTRLFDELGVPTAPSDMSFGASLDGGRVEYGLRDLSSLLAQPANLLRPDFLRMLNDILRFNSQALEVAADPRLTVREFLGRLGTGPWFRDRYLLPLAGAIWSTPTEGVLEFPARALVRFFRNHALLSHTGQHEWMTVRGGSRIYVERLAADLARRGVLVRCGAPVAGIRRRGTGVELRAQGDGWRRYDDVVLATHADVALALLADASVAERAALGTIRFRPNRAVLHADARLMPRRRRVWSSWNYAECPWPCGGRIDLTYWMNSLQPIPADDPLFVTLNPMRSPRPELIHDECTFRHPVYDLATLSAQERVGALNGTRRTWFCGAWLRNGFHEDGLASAIETAACIAARTRAPVAAA